MGYMRVLCELGRDTGIPADTSTNTWHFETTGTVAASAADAVTKLQTFYNAIDAFLGFDNTSSINCKIYDLEDASPRVPVLEQSFGITTGTGQGLPEEMAVCLSYNAAPASGSSVARRRGRLYIGPLVVGVAANTVAGRVTVSSACRVAIAAAAAAMDTPTVDPVWSVFSPTTAGPTPWSAAALGSAFFPVVGGYVDDAFDVQRSRGVAPTTRNTFTV